MHQVQQFYKKEGQSIKSSKKAAIIDATIDGQGYPFDRAGVGTCLYLLGGIGATERNRDGRRTIMNNTNYHSQHCCCCVV